MCEAFLLSLQLLISLEELVLSRRWQVLLAFPLHEFLDECLLLGRFYLLFGFLRLAPSVLVEVVYSRSWDISMYLGVIFKVMTPFGLLSLFFFVVFLQGRFVLLLDLIALYAVVANPMTAAIHISYSNHFHYYYC
jgi:hypothetical protein